MSTRQNYSEGETGEGTITIEGGTYTGQLVNGVANGFGTWEHPAGTIYEGVYKDGKFHGQGIYTLADGGTIEGFFENGEYVGE